MESLRIAPGVNAPPQRRTMGTVWSDLLTVITGAVAALLLWFGLTNTPATAGTMPYVGVWLHLILMSYVGGMLWLFTRALAPRLRTNAILLWLGLFFLAILTIKLKETPFTVGGINGDARFYTTYVTKLAAYPGYGDMFYKDLPAFYPPLYYFLVGRVVDWFNIEPFRVMKYGLLTTVMVLPLATGWLWRRLVDERLAAAVALGMLVFPDWFKPNEWLALALFLPWWLLWVENITAYRPATRPATLRWWLAGGLIGALIFQLYFFWFFVGGVALLVKIGWWFCCRRGDNALRRSVAGSIVMLAVTALCSSPFWGPYLFSMGTTPNAEPLQNRFFGASKIPLPLYFFEQSWQGVVYLGGLLYILLAAQGDQVARGLRRLLIGFVLWVALGYVAVLIDMPLLTFRSYPLLAYLLGAGAFLGLFRLWHSADQLAQRWPTVPWRLLATTLLMLVVLLFANDVIAKLQSEENVQDALAATYPAAELAAFDELTGNDYHNRVVLVTDSYRSILFFRPIYSFMAWSAHFSHPAGRFHDRAAFLEKLAQLHDPLLFAQALTHNQYDRIDYLLLKPADGHWRYSFVDDNFPNRTVDRDIYFPQALFAEPYFASASAAGYTMVQPGAAVALPVADGATADQPLDAVARTYLLATTFAADLALPKRESLRTLSEQTLLTADLSALPVALLLDLRRAATGAFAGQVNEALAAQLNWPAPVLLTDAAGQPRVQLLGHQLHPNPAAENTEITLYWETLAPLDEAYTIWFHAFRTDANKRDVEKLIFDHAPQRSTTTWQPGLVYQDRFTLTLTLPPGSYRFETGLWQPEHDRRLRQASGELGITLGIQPLP